MFEEYEYVNRLIIQDKEFLKSYRTVMYTIFAGLIAFGFSQTKPLIFLVPIFIILPIYAICMTAIDGFIKSEAYILVFSETTKEMQWETRKNILSKSKLKKRKTSIGSYYSLIIVCFIMYIIMKTNYLKVLHRLIDVEVFLAVILFVFSTVFILKKRVNYRDIKDKYICAWENIKWIEQAPLISVILPVYNDSKNIGQAIDSILRQSYTNFELIIINDGSTDNTLEVINTFSDKRIIVIDCEHKGVAYSLNRGLSIARGKYIARMDSDDIAVENRLLIQLSYLQAHPDVKLLNSQYFMLKNKCLTYVKPPRKNSDISIALIFYCCIRHSAIMFEKKVFETGYDTEYNFMEDHYLWVNNINNIKMSTINYPLLIHRKRVGSVTDQYNQFIPDVVAQFEKVQKLALEKHNIYISENIYSFSLLLRKLYASNFCSKEAYRIYKKILKQIPLLKRKYAKRYFYKAWSEYIFYSKKLAPPYLFSIKICMVAFLSMLYSKYKIFMTGKVYEFYARRYNLHD